MSVKGQIEHNGGVDFQGNLTWGMRQPPVGRTAMQQVSPVLWTRDVCSYLGVTQPEQKTIPSGPSVENSENQICHSWHGTFSHF